METINTRALINREAMALASRVDRDVRIGMTLAAALRKRDVPDELHEDVAAIIAAVGAGWFVLPKGKNLTFSKAQHGSMSRLTEKAPWLNDLIVEADAFADRIQGYVCISTPAFGVERLPDLSSDARAARNRLSRLPLDHSTGAITLDLWVQILHDTQSKAEYIRNRIECLKPAWMWDAGHSLSEQVARLKAFGCLDLLIAFISTTQNRFIDRFERRLLEDVRYRGLGIQEYQERWCAELKRRKTEAETVWRQNYSLIQTLASVLDGATSYHHGTLSRRLRQESKGAFKILRSGINDSELVIEIRHHYHVGQGMKIDTPFLLVNYCQALAEETLNAKPTYDAYLNACQRAYSRISTEMTETEAKSDSRPARPPDDFESDAA